MNLTSQMEHPCCRSLLWLLFPSFFPYTLLLSSAFFAQSSRCFSSISFILHALQVALGRNQPLKRERPKWKSDYPMTEGQLRSKRDEFWDTAPAFEGRKEIWDALRAAASAFESNDHLLAQAILDGASITLPHGKNTSIISMAFCILCYFWCRWVDPQCCSWWLSAQEFELLLHRFLEKAHSVSCQECLCVSADFVFRTGLLTDPLFWIQTHSLD